MTSVRTPATIVLSVSPHTGSVLTNVIVSWHVPAVLFCSTDMYLLSKKAKKAANVIILAPSNPLINIQASVHWLLYVWSICAICIKWHPGICCILSVLSPFSFSLTTGTVFIYNSVKTWRPFELCCAHPVTFPTSSHSHGAFWTWLMSSSWESGGDSSVLHHAFIVTVILCDDGSLIQHHLYSSRLADVSYQPVVVPALIFWENERCRNTNY